MSLTGKRFIVTGAASGMGAATAIAYVREGAHVIGFRHDRTGDDVIDRARAGGSGSFDFIHCDVSDKALVESAVAEAVTRLGGLDGLVHAAGIAPGAPAESIDYDEFEKVFAVNMRGTFLTNQAVFPHLRERGGRIINFASPVGVNGMVGKAHYAASKGAVLAWTRSLAREWGVHGITANAIAPAIWTPMYDRTRAAMSPEQLAEHDRTMARIVPLGGKLGDIDRDFVPFMVFLGGDGAGFLTGQTYVIDGGALILS